MIIYSIFPLLGSLFALILSVTVFVKQYKSPVNRSFSFFTFLAFVWLFSYSFLYLSSSQEAAFVLPTARSSWQCNFEAGTRRLLQALEESRIHTFGRVVLCTRALPRRRRSLPPRYSQSPTCSNRSPWGSAWSG